MQTRFPTPAYITLKKGAAQLGFVAKIFKLIKNEHVIAATANSSRENWYVFYLQNLWRVAGTQAGAVFLEADIAHLMETILHAPRPTIEFQQALGRGLGGREGGDERDDLRGRFVGCGTSAGELRDWRDEGMGFFSFETAWRTLQGYEVMNMMRKGQVQGVSKGDLTGQVTFIAHLFAVAA